MKQRSQDSTTPPTFTSLISTELIESHLKIDYAAEQSYIDALGAAVISTLQNDLNASYGAGTITVELDCLERDFTLPVNSSRIDAITISYTDINGSDITLTADDFSVSNVGYPAVVSLDQDLVYDVQTWGFPVSVSITASADTVSPAIEQAALMLLAHWYENREAVGQKMYKTPLAYDRLIANERKFSVRANRYTTR